MKEKYSLQIIQQAKNPHPTQEIKVEGIGTVKVYGEWDAEKIIKRLLQSESITG